MASKALLVFTLLLAFVFLVNCARQEPQPSEGRPAADPNAAAAGDDGSSGYGKVSGHRPQRKYGHRPQGKHGHRPQGKYGYSECDGGDDDGNRYCKWGCCEGGHDDRCHRCCDHGEFSP